MFKKRKMPMTRSDKIKFVISKVFSTGIFFVLALTWISYVFPSFMGALDDGPVESLDILTVLGFLLIPLVTLSFLMKWYQIWEAHWWYDKERFRFREAVERGEAPEFPPLFIHPWTFAMSVNADDLIRSARVRRQLEACAKIQTI